MGLVNTYVLLSNPRRSDLEALRIIALADTGAVHLCIPEHVQHQLKLKALEDRAVRSIRPDRHARSAVTLNPGGI